MAHFDDDSPKRRRALGKGLGALIPKNDGDSEKRRRYVQLEIDRIDFARRQPRSQFDESSLKELADSIRESGLIQPLVVRERQGRYELIAGERRLRACRLAELDKVPAVIRNVSNTEAYTLALIENIQREDLNPVEEAAAYRKLLDDTGASQAELAKRIGKSRPALANSVRLLELHDDILDHLAAGHITSGHARALVPLDDRDARRLAEQIIDHSWSVRKTEDEIRALQSGESKSKTSKKPKKSRYRDDALVRDLTERLQHSLGTKVKLKDRQGKGKIEIYYEDIDILQSVLDRILDE